MLMLLGWLQSWDVGYGYTCISQASRSPDVGWGHKCISAEKGMFTVQCYAFTETQICRCLKTVPHIFLTRLHRWRRMCGGASSCQAGSWPRILESLLTCCFGRMLLETHLETQGEAGVLCIQKLTFKQWHADLAEWEGVASQYMCAVFCKNHTASMQSIVSLLLIVETLRSAMHIFFNLIIAALVFNPASQQKHPRVLQSLTCALARVACRMLGS